MFTAKIGRVSTRHSPERVPSGLLQVDGYAGFGRVVRDTANTGIQLAFCWAHTRRKFYEVQVATKAPLARGSASARIAALLWIEADIRGQSAEDRRLARQQRSRPIVEAMHVWLTGQLQPRLRSFQFGSGHALCAQPLGRPDAFLEDGRLELDTNTVERAIRPVVLTRKNALFAGSDSGGRHWSIVATLIVSAKLNNVELLAWLTDVLERVISGRMKIHEMEKLLPWTWKAAHEGRDRSKQGDAPGSRDRRKRRRSAPPIPPRPRTNANGEC